MNEPPDLVSRFSRKRCLAATFADLRGNVFHQDATVVNREHFAHELVLGGRAAADVALKHGYLRFR